MVELYAVRTTHGSSLLPTTAEALVEVSEGVFIPKPVIELGPGDLVAYRRESIDATLDQVHPSLMDSERYKAAHEALHYTREGRETTKLSELLIKAVSPIVGVNHSDLEERIVSNNFDSSEYNAMAEWINETLGPTETYSKSTVKDWLTGQTLMPRNNQVIQAIANATNNGELQSLTSEKLQVQYKLYTTVRKGIMRYLASKGESTTQSEGSTKHEQHISLRPEITLVLRSFGHTVDKKYAAAAVQLVEVAEQTGSAKETEKGEKLKQGILCSTPDDFSGRVRTLDDICHHHFLFSNVASEVIGKVVYLPQYAHVRGEIQDAIQKLISERVAKSPLLAGMYIRVAHFREVMGQTGFYNEEVENSFDKYFATIEHLRTIAKDIVRGEVDEVLGVAHQTVHKINLLPFNTYRVIPRDLFSRIELMIATKNKTIRQKLARKRLQQRIKTDYDVDIAPDIRTFHLEALGQLGELNTDGETAGIEVVLASDKFAEFRRKKTSQPDHNYFSFGTVTEILTSYGVTDASKLVIPEYYAA